ncbi:molybdenum cofactor biosynthesis protein MoaE [Thiohalorhabdus sp. Cl-TMA]|uniref:Molybdopterin synthase catalytic subunit n=1 Tax=Thiohalorhabdus methylotrophus TaxID=3242694 RepID=A0ABV4TT32_9GAMM
MEVRVQREEFDVGAELAAHRPVGAGAGAEVHFVGNVRDLNDGDEVRVMELEHYPGMTERELERVAGEAGERWEVLDSLVIHRYGVLHPGDRIVLVSVWSPHRGDAFDACRYIIDALKTTAPFWKKETLPDGGHRWVAPGQETGEPVS